MPAWSRTTVSTAVTAPVIAMALAMALSGCSAAVTPAPTASSTASSSASGQTKAAACLVLEKALASSTATLATTFGQIGTDPSKAVAGLKTFAAALDSGLAQVQNSLVKVPAARAAASLKTMNDEVSAVIGVQNADTTKLKAAVIAFRTDFTAIASVCKV